MGMNKIRAAISDVVDTEGTHLAVESQRCLLNLVASTDYNVAEKLEAARALEHQKGCQENKQKQPFIVLVGELPRP